jgi:hypothetical protein
MKYQPKRSTARWLEGAPAPVLAVYDNGGRSADRYLVLYDYSDMGAERAWYEKRREVPARAMSDAPFHPQGVGLYVEVPAWSRAQYGRKVRYADLPADCKRCVEQDCRAE